MKTPVNAAVYVLLGFIAYQRLALGSRRGASSDTAGNEPDQADAASEALSGKKG